MKPPRRDLSLLVWSDSPQTVRECKKAARRARRQDGRREIERQIAELEEGR
jgi:hypothetical protein